MSRPAPTPAVSRSAPPAGPAPTYRGFHVPSARLPRSDYGEGVTFVTIMTRDRELWFGRLERGGVVLSRAGRVVWEEWHRTAEARLNVTLDAFVVMPDHVHGVLWIDGDGRTRAAPPDDASKDPAAPPGSRATDGAAPPATPRLSDGVETPRRGVSTGHRNRHGRGGNTDRPAPWRPGVLGAVVGRFKASCTRRIRETHPAFAWQARFWDVVIRDARHLEAARRYVLDNPTRAGWGQ